MTGISVIIPVYNKKDYLERCIRSVLESSFCDLEIICIDDFSTDGSRELLKDIQKSDNRINVLENRMNMGAAYTRNRGIECSNGKYIVFLDADDYVEKNALGVYYSRLETTKAQGCFLKLCIENSNECGIKHNYDEIYSGLELLDLFAKNDEMFLYACGAIWKTEYIKGNQITFKDLKIGEGGLFVLEALTKADRVVYCEFPGYRYLINPSSTSCSKNSMSLAALGQARQIIYMILQMSDGNNDKEIVSFLIWYLKKHIGGINNLKLSEISETYQMLADNERFLFDLIRGQYMGNAINISPEDESLLKNIGRVYLYGAGYETLDVLKFCNQIGVEIIGIYVSFGKNNSENIYGFKVLEFRKELIEDLSIPFLITAHKKHHEVIRKILLDAGVEYIIEL